MSRTDSADLGVIKEAMRVACAAGGNVGVTAPVNVCLLFGPDFLDDLPNDFQPYPGYESSDGKVAKATQEDLLYFMGFCREQAPMCERMEAMYGMTGQVRDAITDYSTPASGSFDFVPSVEALDETLG